MSENLDQFIDELKRQEVSPKIIANYLADLRCFWRLQRCADAVASEANPR